MRVGHQTSAARSTVNLPARGGSRHTAVKRRYGIRIQREAYMAKEDDKQKTFKIYVNGVEKVVDHDVLAYDEVVRLFIAHPVEGTIYAVSYEHGREPKEGELVAGGSVTIKNNTQFDVDDTGRS